MARRLRLARLLACDAALVSVWARGASDRLLIRLDPASNHVVAEYGPAAGAGAVAVGHGAIWISAYNEQKVWRGPLPS